MNSTVSIAYMSESCNDFYICELNVFSFSGARKKVIKSGDEKYDVTIVKNSTKGFKVDLLCGGCSENRSCRIPEKGFWWGQVGGLPG